MQQEQINFDLLAVFNTISDADAAETKLHREGFGDNEVFRLTADAVAGGQFREHGPSRERSAIFLQTTRTGPNPVTVILLAIVFGIVLGAVMFGVADFTFKQVIPATIIGAVVGIILGAIAGLLQRGRVRGAIGQDVSKVTTPVRKPEQGARTVIGVSLSDPENITRKSKARAILLNNKGKIARR